MGLFKQLHFIFHNNFFDNFIIFTFILHIIFNRSNFDMIYSTFWFKNNFFLCIGNVFSILLYNFEIILIYSDYY